MMLEYEKEIKEVYNSLHNATNIYNNVKPDTKEKITDLSKGLVYLLLVLGVPKKQLPLIITNALNYCSSREISLIFTKKKQRFKKNKKCAICGSSENLTVHHIKPTGRGYEYLKFNPMNWLVLCRECHDFLHKMEGVK